MFERIEIKLYLVPYQRIIIFPFIYDQHINLDINIIRVFADARSSARCYITSISIDRVFLALFVVGTTDFYKKVIFFPAKVICLPKSDVYL